MQLACIPDEYNTPYQSNYLFYGAKGFTLGYTLFYNAQLGINSFLAEFPITIYNRENCTNTNLFPINHTEQLICAGGRFFPYF